MLDYFAHTTPEEAGIPSSAIEDFLDYATEFGIELHSLMVLRHGRVCAEGWWKPYSSNIAHPIASLTKSLTSIALGFAEQEGLLRLDERIIDIFPDKLPEHPSEYLKDVTIEHLLVMGYGQEEDPHGNQARNYGSDWMEKFLAQPLVYKPGTAFRYSDTGVNLLSALITRKSGVPMFEYLQSRLFAPLGMTLAFSNKMPDGAIDIAHGQTRFCTEDIAKFMQFVLNNGMWEGKQLLNKSWFERATAYQISTDEKAYTGQIDSQQGYGYFFWRCSFEDAFRGTGAFGQFGIILPKQDMVIVTTAGTKRMQWLLSGFFEKLISKTSENALPEDPQAAERLGKRLAALTLPALPAGRSPDFEEKLRSKYYIAKEPLNGMDALVDTYGYLENRTFKPITGLSFSFADDVLELGIDIGGKGETLSIGLRNDFRYSSFDGNLYAAVGRWRADWVFEAEIRNMVNFGAGRLLFRFDSGGMTLITDFTLILDSGSGAKAFCGENSSKNDIVKPSAMYRFLEGTEL